MAVLWSPPAARVGPRLQPIRRCSAALNWNLLGRHRGGQRESGRGWVSGPSFAASVPLAAPQGLSVVFLAEHPGSHPRVPPPFPSSPSHFPLTHPPIGSPQPRWTAVPRRRGDVRRTGGRYPCRVRGGGEYVLQQVERGTVEERGHFSTDAARRRNPHETFNLRTHTHRHAQMGCPPQRARGGSTGKIHQRVPG